MVKDLVAARCRSWPMYEQYLDAARRELDLSDDDLWVAYVTLGGSLSAVQLRNYFDGDYALDAREYDYLAQALNDRYMIAARTTPCPMPMPSPMVMIR